MKFKTRFFTENKEINYMLKGQMNIIIAKSHSIAFAKIFENKISAQLCEAGTAVIKQTTADYNI
jgi:hypothetical protein